MEPTSNLSVSQTNISKPIATKRHFATADHCILHATTGVRCTQNCSLPHELDCNTEHHTCVGGFLQQQLIFSNTNKTAIAMDWCTLLRDLSDTHSRVLFYP